MSQYSYTPWPTPTYAPPPPPLPSEKLWPVPSGRLVPFFWAGALVVLTLIAIAASILAPLTAPQVPTVTGSLIYQNALSASDGHWDTSSTSEGQCAYELGGLHASTSNSNAISSACRFDQALSNLHLSVHILPQVDANIPLHPVIVIRSSVAFLFDTNGAFAILDFADPARTTILAQPQFTAEWHGLGAKSNLVTIHATGTTYTLGINGVQVYQATFAGTNTSGNIALGAHSTPFTAAETDAAGEAVFTDFSLSAP